MLTDLRTAGIKTKVRPLSNGRTIGGIPFTRGALAAFLRNRFYIGEVKYKAKFFLESNQPYSIGHYSMLSRPSSTSNEPITLKLGSSPNSLLMGRIFDDRGNRMTPTCAVKKGVRYRYYISAPLMQGQSDKAAKLNRVPAVEIEILIISAVRKQLGMKSRNEMETEDSISLNDQELISPISPVLT